MGETTQRHIVTDILMAGEMRASRVILHPSFLYNCSTGPVGEGQPRAVGPGNQCLVWPFIAGGGNLSHLEALCEGRRRRIVAGEGKVVVFEAGLTMHAFLREVHRPKRRVRHSDATWAGLSRPIRSLSCREGEGEDPIEVGEGEQLVAITAPLEAIALLGRQKGPLLPD